MKTALDRYLELQLEVIDQLDVLRNIVENPEISAENINWSYVGDLNHIKNILKDLINPED